jgi:hypothetical protein
MGSGVGARLKAAAPILASFCCVLVQLQSQQRQQRRDPCFRARRSTFSPRQRRRPPPQVAPVKPPMAVTNAVSWRSEGIRHKKNEVGRPRGGAGRPGARAGEGPL